ncbi:MAG: LCP family protein [Dermatophilaceae bacterium]
MTGPHRGPDEARPLPRHAPDDDVVTVDTRRSFSFRRPDRGPNGAQPGGSGQGGPPGQGLSQPAPSTPAASSRRIRLRRVLVVVAVLAVAWVAFMLWVPFSAWRGVQRVDNEPASRPADTGGKNYLLVGSDSRAGITDAEAKELGTDNEDVGQHTDSIMLVHVSEQGHPPVIVSIPRDSYVPIPGKGTNKINASYAFGGPKLLTNTVEQVTGIHVDGYLEVGFAGFAGIVDSLGGVEVCVPAAMKDASAGLDVSAGCQTMDGKTSLAYVRARHSDPKGDLGRAERQRQFLGAVVKKAASPSTVLLPPRYLAFANAASQGLVVGDTTSLSDAVAIVQAMRQVSGGDGISMQVPVDNAAYQTRNAGVAVKWNDAKAKALFAAIKNDEGITAPAS